MRLVGANSNARVAGRNELPGKSNYFIGNDPSKWRTNIPTYAKVDYQDLLPGIDLVYYGNQGHLEYDFAVAPGANPGRIRLAIDGTGTLEVDASGDLIARAGGSEMRWRKPVVYQVVNGNRRLVAARYVLGRSGVGFEIANYDRKQPLVIDPVLVYSTYLGGKGDDQAKAIAIDTAGSAYVVGVTTSTDFPTVNAIKPTIPFGPVSFVSKINSAGTALVYSTYLDGDPGILGSAAYSLAVDAAGSAYVAGYTTSADFPIVNAFQPHYSGGSDIDAYVAKLSPDGSALLFSTYIGVVTIGQPVSIAVDSSGSAYIAGSTSSKNFPTTAGALQPKYTAGQEGFVTKLTPDGSGLVYSTYLWNGNSGFFYSDLVSGIAVDSAGNAYIAGQMYGLSVTASLQSTSNSGIRVAMLNASGSALVYSTAIGGYGSTSMAIAVDSAGNAYVTGYCGGNSTVFSNFPTVNAFQPNPGTKALYNAIIFKLNAAGSALVYSTFLGGGNNSSNADDEGHAIAVDSAGNAYVTGYATSSDFPTTNALAVSQGTIFVSEFNPSGSSLVFSTTIYVAGGFFGAGIAVDSSSNVYVAGSAGYIPAIGTVAARTAVLVNPLQAGFGGGNSDAFVLKIGANAARSSVALSIPASGEATAVSIGGSGATQAGYATLDVNSGNTPYGTAVFSLTQNGVVVSEAGVPASPPTTAARIFIDYRSSVAAIPGRSSAGTINIDTGIAVVNYGSASANLTYTLRNIAGTTLSTGHGTLAAGAHFATFIDQLKQVAPDFVLPANFLTATQFASLDISSDQPISVLALRMTTNQRNEALFTTTPTADLKKPATNSVIFFPQFADGGGYTTSLVLLNTSSGSETGTIQILDDNGNPFVVNQVGGTAGSTFRYSIPGGGAVRFQTDGSPVTTKAGWAQLTPDAGTSTPIGAGVFSYNPGNFLVTESGIPATVSTTHARIYVDLSGGHDTGLAIANPTSTKASITITAFQSDGVTGIGTSQGPLQLPANGDSAFFADGFIAGLPAGFTGVLDITSSTPFAALTMRSLINERNDFLLATFPIADMTLAAPSPIVFPQIADGGGYVTQFILIGAGGASSVTLNYYGEDGKPLAVGK
jgi:hypothetical protein